MAVGLREFTQRAADGAGLPVLDTEHGEELMHVQPNVAIVLANLPPVSPGTLYITSKQVLWLSDVDRTKGYAVDFFSLSLHAVSRDPEAYPSPCIYTQIETEAESVDSDSETTESLELSRITEMRLIPSDPSQLDTLFEMFCECAELNPEPTEEEEEHNWIFNADQMEDDTAEGDDIEWQFNQNQTSLIGQANGDNELAHSVLELHINDERFEDAEEVECKTNGKHQ